MNEPKIDYAPNGSANLVHRSKALVKVISGPVGSGKTSVALMEYFLLCMESVVPVRGVVIRSSYRELQDSTRATFEEWFGDIAYYKERDEKAIMPLPHPTNPNKVLEHELMFRSCRRVEEATKFLSTEFGFGFLEECVPAYQTNGVMGSGLPESLLNILITRMRQKGVKRKTILCTFNPPTPRHWTYNRFFKPKAETLAKNKTILVKQPPGENNANLPDGYYDNIRATMSDPDMIRRFVDGEVVAIYDGTRVFPECNERLHVRDELEPIPGTELVLGFDYGLSPATLIAQIDRRGQWRILRELQSFNCAMDSHAERLRALLNEEFPEFKVGRCYGDPAGATRSQTDEKTAVNLLAAKGFKVISGKQNWQMRKEAMKQRFLRNIDSGDPAVAISRDGCPLLVEGFLGAYRYPSSRDGQIARWPIKNEASHLQDCAQYIATMEFNLIDEADSQRIREQRRAKIGLPKFDPLSETRAAPRRSWLEN